MDQSRTGNMIRVLRAIGCIDIDSSSEQQKVSKGMGVGRRSDFHTSVRSRRKAGTACDPVSQQLTWSTIIEFCIERFEMYKTQKSSVGQWSDDGRKLKELALRKNVAEIRKLFRLRAG